ncbi:MAG TPA: 50S ribosomal protein L3 N(5)-glutamine methyltransferase [Gammaproteobacteria bacterium]|nr:50S ribosomal protein L3 N(5)-glutamine methyltransferase [Gammaproteobacteria bacterium]
MSAGDLERRLRAARDCDAWIAVLADYFDAHRLVFGHGTDNAADEAFWLLRHLQDWRDVDFGAPPAAELVPRALAIAERRVDERQPLAYLINEAWFAGLKFFVDERVLVPRSPLAEVLEREFAPWTALRDGDRVLDIGTGSGCIAIAAAHYCAGVTVDATDISAAALEVAARNVAQHGLGSRVRLFEADLFPPAAERYRVIVSNPPYVPEAEVAALPAEYRHEPELGLASGPTGFAAAERILRGALDRLTADGVLFLELGAGAERFAAANARLPLIALAFERGGDGVLVTTAAELRQFLHAS